MWSRGLFGGLGVARKFKSVPYCDMITAICKVKEAQGEGDAS
jgi:hypothetical protein